MNEINLEQNKNNNSAAEAREARRRRILENSNNRLGKITGRVHNEEIPKIEIIEQNGVYPDPELERDVFEGPTNTNNQDVFELLKTLQNDPNNTEDPTRQQPVPQSPLSRFIRTSKYPIIIIALVAYSLFALNLDRLIGSSVFSLFILWEIFVFIMTAFVLKEPVQQNQLIVLMGMFLGLNSHILQLIMKILGLFNKILRDVAIFLFTFVFVHLVYSYVIIGERMSEILDKDFNKLLSKDEL